MLAAALAMHIDVEVVETGRFRVHSELSIARDRRNLVVRGFARLHPPDDFEFRIASDVPLSGGLGTSAAAYVAGLLAADSIFELDADVLALATELEGHPDNVAAALLGGIVLCADGEATRFDPPAGLEAVLVVPHRSVRTTKARAVLPPQVPMADAVFNVAHASLLVLGLVQGRLDLVGRGLAGPAAPAAPRRAVPRVDRAARAGAGVRRFGGDDLGCRPDGAGVERVRRDGGCGGAAAGRGRRVGRGAAGAVRADGGGCAGAGLRPSVNCALRRGCGVPRRSFRPGVRRLTAIIRLNSAHPRLASRRGTLNLPLNAQFEPYARMNTGVPAGTVRISRRMSRVCARMHPNDAARPTVSVFGVAWIARRSPPGQPSISFVWWPESASAQQP